MSIPFSLVIYELGRIGSNQGSSEVLPSVVGLTWLLDHKYAESKLSRTVLTDTGIELLSELSKCIANHDQST